MLIQTRLSQCLRRVPRRQQEAFGARMLATQTLGIKQDGTLYLDFSNTKANLKIVTLWQDHCEIDLNSPFTERVVKVTPDLSTNSFSMKSESEEGSAETVDVEIRIPEYFNLQLKGDHLDMYMGKKVQGDISVTSQSGTIHVDKARGEHVQFLSPQGHLHVKKSLEGNVHVAMESIASKMINGDKVYLESSEPIKIGAFYAKNAEVKCKRGAHIGLLTGSLKLQNDAGDVKISGIDGTFDVSSADGDVEVAINKLAKESKGSGTVKTKGNLAVFMDPEISTKFACTAITHDEINNNISVLSDAFTKDSDSMELCEDHGSDPTFMHVMHGRLSGLSAAAKRPRFASSTPNRSGKIDLDGSDLFSLGANASQSNTDSDVPDLSFEVTSRSASEPAKITIETLSWIETIRRKHGMGDVPFENANRREADDAHLTRKKSHSMSSKDKLKEILELAEKLKLEERQK